MIREIEGFTECRVSYLQTIEIQSHWSSIITILSNSRSLIRCLNHIKGKCCHSKEPENLFLHFDFHTNIRESGGAQETLSRSFSSIFLDHLEI